MELINVLFNKNNKNDEDLERINTKIDGLSEHMNALSKNMVGLSITVNKALCELNEQLPVFADTIVKELGNSIDDLLISPKSDCCCSADGIDYVNEVYHKLGNRKDISVYTPRGLYFDGYNFIVKTGQHIGSISFTIDDLETIQRNLKNICEIIVKNDYQYSIVYKDLGLRNTIFVRLLFNIIDGTFNDIERFKENPIKK